MKPLFRLLIVCSLAAAPAAFAAPANSELYSFTDIARLTETSLVEAPLAAADPAAPRFAVGPLHQPGRWVLLLAGLAAAGWVAHRRLAHAF